MVFPKTKLSNTGQLLVFGLLVLAISNDRLPGRIEFPKTDFVASQKGDSSANCLTDEIKQQSGQSVGCSLRFRSLGPFSASKASFYN